MLAAEEEYSDADMEGLRGEEEEEDEVEEEVEEEGEEKEVEEEEEVVYVDTPDDLLDFFSNRSCWGYSKAIQPSHSLLQTVYTVTRNKAVGAEDEDEEVTSSRIKDLEHEVGMLQGKNETLLKRVSDSEEQIGCLKKALRAMQQTMRLMQDKLENKSASSGRSSTPAAGRVSTPSEQLCGSFPPSPLVPAHGASPVFLKAVQNRMAASAARPDAVATLAGAESTASVVAVAKVAVSGNRKRATRCVDSAIEAHRTACESEGEGGETMSAANREQSITWAISGSATRGLPALKSERACGASGSDAGTLCVHCGEAGKLIACTFCRLPSHTFCASRNGDACRGTTNRPFYCNRAACQGSAFLNDFLKCGPEPRPDSDRSFKCDICMQTRSASLFRSNVEGDGAEHECAVCLHCVHRVVRDAPRGADELSLPCCGYRARGVDGQAVADLTSNNTAQQESLFRRADYEFEAANGGERMTFDARRERAAAKREEKEKEWKERWLSLETRVQSLAVDQGIDLHPKLTDQEAQQQETDEFRIKLLREMHELSSNGDPPTRFLKRDWYGLVFDVAGFESRYYRIPDETPTNVWVREPSKKKRKASG